MEFIEISILCTVTDTSYCRKMKSEIFEKLYPLARAAGIGLSIDVVTLPLTSEDTTIKLPAVSVVDRKGVKLFELGCGEPSSVGIYGAQPLTAEAMSL